MKIHLICNLKYLFKIYLKYILILKYFLICTFSIGNKRVPAHRLVLSAGSEYFAAMFTSSLRESAQNEIELMDVDGDALWALVLYCYTGNSV